MKTGTPITIAEAVRRVTTERFVLPGIQRSFVWRADQICDLFDSLLRGYPIGNLIVWRTRPQDHRNLPFRRLVTDARGKDTTPSLAHPAKSRRLDAVLDGQQRLTALAIGLAGSNASSEHGRITYLHLDLEGTNSDAGTEERMYQFRFLSEKQARRENAAGEASWLRVDEAYRAKTTAITQLLIRNDLRRTRAARSTLRRLIEVVNEELTISSLVESTNDLDRVLNIFSRINKGGTHLTYVDLLVGAATAKWQESDAAIEINTLVDRLNATRPSTGPATGFRFNADRVVKASLVLLGANEPKFHVENFLRGNLGTRLEREWPEFSRAMEVAVKVLAEFGLSRRTLPGQNVVIPVAYYAWHRGLRPSYATAHAHEKDRRLVRAFVARTLLQRAYWTGDVDPILVATRKAIAKHGSQRFPLAELERSMPKSKPIRVTRDLVNELSVLPYSDRRTASLLALLFPGIPASDPLEKDHIFPRGRLSDGRLAAAGIDRQDRSIVLARAELLPNLQLLAKSDNINKSSKMPYDWFNGLSASAKGRYRMQGVKYLPEELSGTVAFWDRRQSSLNRRISNLLNGRPLGTM